MKWLLFIVFLSFFIVEISSQFTFNTIGDDQVYYYMGKLVAEGQHPFRDFFFAHNPLQLILYGLIFKIFPYGFHIFKVIFILLTIANYYLLYSIVKSEFNGKIALIATTIGLFAPTILYNASFEYGLTVALFLFLLGLKYEDKPLLQGFLFLLASLYRFHLVFLVIGYIVYNICIGKYIYLKRGIWIANIWLLINGTLTFIVPNYFKYVFLYHLHKPGLTTQTFLTISTILKMNYLMFLLPLILLLFYIKETDKNIGKYILIPVPLLMLFIKSTFFGYYFVLILPFLAVIGAYAIYKIGHPLIYAALFFFVFISAFNYATIQSSIPEFEIGNKDLIGDPPTISYLALIKGNRIMDNEIDTNSMIYDGGIKNITYFITNIMIKHPLVIVKKDEGLYARNQEFRDYVDTCNLAQEIKDYKIVNC